jgi:hypothetical protein
MEKGRLEFPNVTGADIAFGGYDKAWFKKTLAIEELPEDKEFEGMATQLFFSGGSVAINKDLPEEYVSKGLRILKAVLGSFEPKHEHKEKVCGLILKSICMK